MGKLHFCIFKVNMLCLVVYVLHVSLTQMQILLRYLEVAITECSSCNSHMLCCVFFFIFRFNCTL